MSVQIQTPRITGGTDRERLQQIQSYLYQMAQQLQWAFDTIEAGSTATSSYTQQTTGGKSKQEAARETFAGIKDLIIKSADIVNAYYVQINKRLEGLYLAQSDFGSYREDTALDIQANNTSINQLFTNTRQIFDTVDSLYNTVIGSTAYMKTGLLYEDEDGVPVYGLEIGQTNNVDGEDVFEKFARFSADRLSFFDQNAVEVAYISDYRLYITNADITGTLNLFGKFKVYYNKGMIFKWTGGE